MPREWMAKQVQILCYPRLTGHRPGKEKLMEYLQDKRLWIAIAVVVVVLFAANAAGWLGS
jgi:hypothetical protein